MSPELRAPNPHIPWQIAADTRDRLTHGYDRVDYAVIWSTVTDDLPPLVPGLEAVLEKLENATNRPEKS